MRKSTDSMLSPIITMVPQKSIIIILLISAILYVKFFFIIKQERITIISHRTYYNYFPYFGNIMLNFFTIKQERITTFNHTFTKKTYATCLNLTNALNNDLYLLSCADDKTMCQCSCCTVSIRATFDDFSLRHWTQVMVDNERSHKWSTMLQTYLLRYINIQASGTCSFPQSTTSLTRWLGM